MNDNAGSRPPKDFTTLDIFIYLMGDVAQKCHTLDKRVCFQIYAFLARNFPYNDEKFTAKFADSLPIDSEFGPSTSMFASFAYKSFFYLMEERGFVFPERMECYEGDMYSPLYVMKIVLKLFNMGLFKEAAQVGMDFLTVLGCGRVGKSRIHPNLWVPGKTVADYIDELFAHYHLPDIPFKDDYDMA